MPAALLQRRVVFQGDRPRSLVYLAQLCKMGLLARKGYGPTAAKWRARGEDQAKAAGRVRLLSASSPFSLDRAR